MFRKLVQCFVDIPVYESHQLSRCRSRLLTQCSDDFRFALQPVIDQPFDRFMGRIDYITVPILLKIQADTAKIRPYAVVGPELGFKVRAGASVATTAYVPGDILNVAEHDLSDQIDDYSKSTDVALNFGGGIEIPSGRMSILIEGIYSLGLRNIAIPSEGEDGSAKTRTFLFNVGIRF